MSVLMSKSFINFFNRIIQMADSFRNESIVCPYEWATESIGSLDSCVLLRDTQQFCCGFNRNYFRQSHIISTSCLLKYYIMAV